MGLETTTTSTGGIRDTFCSNCNLHRRTLFKMKIGLFLTVFLGLAGYSFQSSLPPNVKECHPVPREGATHYIIGYGSLINEESKRKTYPQTGMNIPVRVNGFKRTWTARGFSNSTLSTTFLGVELDPDSALNGVIYSVPNAVAVSKYDERERLYCRVKVPWDDITIVRGKISDNGTFPSEDELKESEFWIYVTIPKFSEYPDEKFPIVQSYVDIFLGGCVQMERKYGLSNFAEECVTKTKGWEYPWVNDRIHPRRPWQYQAEAWHIDKLITKFIPDYNSRIYLERIYVGRGDKGAGNSVTATITPIAVAVLFTVRNFILNF